MTPTAGGPVRAISVSDYAALVRRAAASAGSALVEGEAQRPRRTPGGAFFFDLSDGESRLPCRLLPHSLRWLAHAPEEGDLVRVAVARPDFWPAGGVLSLRCEQVRLTGEGELLRRRRELVARLRSEGLTEPGGLPPLPRFPAGVGVIAGAGSSALADVLACLAERFPRAGVYLAPGPVQGPGAARSIGARLRTLAARPGVEVILLARGGGSVADLAPFDDEGLCRALRASPTPVVAAVGHADNDPVCNLVTHSAHVPRHAAELAVPDRRQLLGALDGARGVLERAEGGTRRELAERRAELAALAEARGPAPRLDAVRSELGRLGRPLAGSGRRQLGAARRAIGAELDGAERTILRCGRSGLAGGGSELERLRRAASAAGGRQLQGLRRNNTALFSRLAAGDPGRRGWVRLSDAAGRPVSSVEGVRVGGRMRVTLRDGELAVRVLAAAPGEPR